MKTKGKVIPFKTSQKRERTQMTQTLSRTTADAVQEDRGLWEPVTREVYEQGIKHNNHSGPALGNRGGIASILQRAEKIRAERGYIDPFADDTDE
jgi:hypothetical protein